jgi:hypothetical protein
MLRSTNGLRVTDLAPTRTIVHVFIVKRLFTHILHTFYAFSGLKKALMFRVQPPAVWYNKINGGRRYKDLPRSSTFVSDELA